MQPPQWDFLKHNSHCCHVNHLVVNEKALICVFCFLASGCTSPHPWRKSSCSNTCCIVQTLSVRWVTPTPSKNVGSRKGQSFQNMFNRSRVHKSFHQPSLGRRCAIRQSPPVSQMDSSATVKSSFNLGVWAVAWRLTWLPLSSPSYPVTRSCSQAPLLTVRAQWWIALPKLLIREGQRSGVGCTRPVQSQRIALRHSAGLKCYCAKSCRAIMVLRAETSLDNFFLKADESQEHLRVSIWKVQGASESIRSTCITVEIMAMQRQIRLDQHSDQHNATESPRSSVEKSRRLKVSDMCGFTAVTPPLM